eukprot:TRINITY_DN14774_c0_g1_i2.p1 TRINITY_DN14774_c0_g1~~TRINITY_DN14774_c0_g1_i2.p1  ORF type:complete len:175 (-),score=29.47 TRINITY_DN14774_c0_g1_i2:96-620(-)
MYLECDVPHIPGLLAVTVNPPARKAFRLVTCHLVPSLPNSTWPYRFTNLLNSLFRKVPDLIRQRHTHSLLNHHQESSSRDESFILLGDLNISFKSDEWHQFHDLVSASLQHLSLRDHVSTVCEVRFPPHSIGAGQIDFVFVDVHTARQAASLLCQRYNQLFGSDHYPVMAHIHL